MIAKISDMINFFKNGTECKGAIPKKFTYKVRHITAGIIAESEILETSLTPLETLMYIINNFETLEALYIKTEHGNVTIPRDVLRQCMLEVIFI